MSSRVERRCVRMIRSCWLSALSTHANVKCSRRAPKATWRAPRGVRRLCKRDSGLAERRKAPPLQLGEVGQQAVELTVRHASSSPTEAEADSPHRSPLAKRRFVARLDGTEQEIPGGSCGDGVGRGCKDPADVIVEQMDNTMGASGRLRNRVTKIVKRCGMRCSGGSVRVG
jgi:hypothetical protein